jgi:uncharacterized SAM-binding protein YcdF (DUF218 family)
MLYVFSKLFEIAINPGTVLVAALALGVVLYGFGVRRAGATLVVAVTVICVALLVLPLGEWAAAPLEDRFPQPRLPDRIDGIVLLGGFLSLPITRAHGQPALNEMADRFTETLALARRYPNSVVLVSGGNASLRPEGPTEAAIMRAMLIADGLDAGRILTEDRSRNTFENAVDSKEVAKPRPGQVWVLVTSANHMPRAIGCFRHVGWDLIPYPVDYSTGSARLFLTSFAGNLRLIDWDLHEWLGLVAYRVLGRIDTLFPGPEPAAAVSAR